MEEVRLSNAKLRAQFELLEAIVPLEDPLNSVEPVNLDKPLAWTETLTDTNHFLLWVCNSSSTPRKIRIPALREKGNREAPPFGTVRYEIEFDLAPKLFEVHFDPGLPVMVKTPDQQKSESRQDPILLHSINRIVNSAFSLRTNLKIPGTVVFKLYLEVKGELLKVSTFARTVGPGLNQVSFGTTSACWGEVSGRRFFPPV
jgi:hypothetical protein